jgi:hypothetical protein
MCSENMLELEFYGEKYTLTFDTTRIIKYIYKFSLDDRCNMVLNALIFSINTKV